MVAGTDRTLLVAPGGSLDRSDWQQIADAHWSHLVLVRPSYLALEVLAPGVQNASATLAKRSRAPDCELKAAVQSGTVTVAGTSYTAPESAKACYGDGINHTVVRLETEGRIVDVIGSPRTFTNAELAKDGNAALALNLIGTHLELVWYLPSSRTPAPRRRLGRSAAGPAGCPVRRLDARLRRVRRGAVARPATRAGRSRTAAGHRACSGDHRRQGSALPSLAGQRPCCRRIA